MSNIKLTERFVSDFNRQRQGWAVFFMTEEAARAYLVRDYGEEFADSLWPHVAATSQSGMWFRVTEWIVRKGNAQGRAQRATAMSAWQMGHTGRDLVDCLPEVRQAEF